VHGVSVQKVIRPCHSREGHDGGAVTHCHANELGLAGPEQLIVLVATLEHFTSAPRE
jgi:hypothetical protein